MIRRNFETFHKLSCVICDRSCREPGQKSALSRRTKATAFPAPTSVPKHAPVRRVLAASELPYPCVPQAAESRTALWTLDSEEFKTFQRRFRSGVAGVGIRRNLSSLFLWLSEVCVAQTSGGG